MRMVRNMFTLKYRRYYGINCHILVVVVGLGSTVTSCATEFAAPVWVGFVDWGVPFVYGAILCTLALIKGWQYWKEIGCFGTNLVKVLIIDQAIYYLVCVSVVSSNAHADSQLA